MTIPTPAPRFYSRPRPGAIHDADACARLAAFLGRPLMPSQWFAIRVGTERRASDPRRFRFREVRVSFPRQAGKTVMLHVKNLHRTITYARLQAFYTAQTGKDARERWLDARTLVDDSPLARFADVKLAAGHTGLWWPNGSAYRPFAPTAASLHGYTPGSVDTDEEWEYDELQGEALDGAISPAQITLPHAQRWRTSTMGDADSTYWHRLVDEGRLATDDPDSDICYIEYSAPEDADLYDPAVLASFHPAIGHTIGAADLLAEAGRVSPGTWRRAYCNLRTTTRESIVDIDAFTELGNPALRITGKAATLAYDCAFDSSQASISLARRAGEDSVSVRVVRSAPGVAWLADAVCELADRFGLRVVHADDGGPTRDVTDELRRRGREVITATGPQYATACGAWLRRCKDGRLEHDRSAVLVDAMRAAVTRPMGDAVAFSRRHSKGPIDALIASTVAVRAALLAPAPAPAPLIIGA